MYTSVKPEVYYYNEYKSSRRLVWVYDSNVGLARLSIDIPSNSRPRTSPSPFPSPKYILYAGDCGSCAPTRTPRGISTVGNKRAPPSRATSSEVMAIKSRLAVEKSSRVKGEPETLATLNPSRQRLRSGRWSASWSRWWDPAKGSLISTGSIKRSSQGTCTHVGQPPSHRWGRGLVAYSCGLWLV